MKHVIVYQGKRRVSLGLMQEAYIPEFLPWINWRLGVEGTLQRPPYSHAMGVEWVRGLDKSKGEHEVFAILVRSNGTKPGYGYIGHMGIHKQKFPGIFETGSLIGAYDAQGKGFGTEAKLLLLYHAFMVMGVRKVVSNVKAWNAQSAGHLLKCGYQYRGREPEHVFHEGAFVDSLSFSLLRRDWEPIWERYQQTGSLPSLTDKQRTFLKREAKNK